MYVYIYIYNVYTHVCYTYELAWSSQWEKAAWNDTWPEAA